MYFLRLYLLTSLSTFARISGPSFWWSGMYTLPTLSDMPYCVTIASAIFVACHRVGPSVRPATHKIDAHRRWDDAKREETQSTTTFSGMKCGQLFVVGWKRVRDRARARASIYDIAHNEQLLFGRTESERSRNNTK